MRQLILILVGSLALTGCSVLQNKDDESQVQQTTSPVTVNTVEAPRETSEEPTEATKTEQPTSTPEPEPTSTPEPEPALVISEGCLEKSHRLLIEVDGKAVLDRTTEGDRRCQLNSKRTDYRVVKTAPPSSLGFAVEEVCDSVTLRTYVFSGDYDLESSRPVWKTAEPFSDHCKEE